MDITKVSYDKIAEDWHKDHSDDDWWIDGTDTFAKMLQKDAEVLDVGCGGGTKSKYLTGKGFNVTGIDFSKSMVEIAKREVPQGEFHVLDMRNVLDLGKEFDGVFAQASLLHIPKSDVLSVIKKLVSVVKPGGIVYAAVKKIRLGQSSEEIKLQDDFGYEYKQFFSYFDLEEMRRYFKNAGLDIVWENEKQSGNTTWIQIIGKKITGQV